MKPITLEEIEHASNVLFNDSNKFYDDIEAKTGERIDVIQSLESIDVNACPGSGKTTALLAKLIILANRMPFEDGRGICVLTHTNVAIDLIKEKLGVGASKLFAYPNFFGTIQSFVDRFLAIPFCAFDKNARITHVDVDRVFYESRKYYYALTFGAKESPTLKNTLYRAGTRDSDWDSSTTAEKNFNAVNYLSKLVFDYEEDKLLVRINGKTFRTGSSKSERVKNDFQQIVEFKNSLIQNGIISYDDAYSLAFEYLHKFPEICKAFTERFKYVFVDEMQDTADHQIKIIDDLFKDDGDTVVQYYGDPNQAIFESEGQKDGGWNPDPNAPTTLKLKKSKRFGKPIAEAINPIRVIPEEENLIEGEEPNSILKPCLFLFNKDQNHEAILDIFGKVIIENQLHKLDKTRFVAIGRVGREHDKGELSLKSYFPEYEKEKSKKKEFYPYLIQYLRKDIIQSGQLKQASNSMLNAILHILELHEFRNEYLKKGNHELITKRFSKTSFLNFLKYSHEAIYFELKEKLIFWSNCIASNSTPFSVPIKEDIEDFVGTKVLPLKGKAFYNDLDFFKVPLEIQTVIDQPDNEEVDLKQKERNIYNFKYQEEEKAHELPIKVNTIHGEKGETHTATLYLETYFMRYYDSYRVKEQLLGGYFTPKGPQINMAAKMAYVAMSRPRYLLCFAVQKSLIQDVLDNPLEKEKLENIWEIIEV